MEKIVKQSVGIDCSKDELDVCFGQQNELWQIHHKATTTFKNNKQGFSQLVRWSMKLADKSVPVNFVIEATGVYHERVTHHLFDAQKRISVVLPNRARHFAQTLTVRTVNDKESSKMLATLGLEKQLDAWQKPESVFTLLKQLTREREQLKNESTMCKNQLHAESHSAFPIKSSMQRINKRIGMLEKQCTEIETEIEQIVAAHPNIAEKVEKISTIKGIGRLTVVTVVAEANGFNLIRNYKQLVSYAGYDVVTKDSGTSVRGKPHISGKGNKHIRRVLHFPALTNVKYDEHHKNLYTRIEAKSGIKMKGYTAVQRKLLVLIYTLWKKNEPYDPNYKNGNVHKNLEQPIGAALTELDLVRSTCPKARINLVL
ncbi:MAG: IS110 family transposase [Nitrosopumilus sp.]|nr:IS110 family transposase [Nitrosopumilus sp.]